MPLVGWGLMLIAYTTLFTFYGRSGLISGLQRALINTVPAALLSIPIYFSIRSYAIERRVLMLVSFHFVAAILFSVLWYIGIQVGYGLRDGWVTNGITGRPLLGVALSWQGFQGVTLYAVIALFTYAAYYRQQWLAAEARLSDLAKKAAQAVPKPASPKQVLVKDGRDYKPVSVAEIIALSGAGDYTEIVTASGRHLSTTSLSKFETELPSSDFARVHRSHIVRLSSVISVESAGNGRLTLHMPSGLSVTTSRAGARVIREKAV
ncbi:MAG: LytTR family DNA-binding domain-containing protein [Pseudomonadota bacterium]